MNRTTQAIIILVATLLPSTALASEDVVNIGGRIEVFKRGHDLERSCAPWEEQHPGINADNCSCCITRLFLDGDVNPSQTCTQRQRCNLDIVNALGQGLPDRRIANQALVAKRFDARFQPHSVDLTGSEVLDVLEIAREEGQPFPDGANLFDGNGHVRRDCTFVRDAAGGHFTYHIYMIKQSAHCQAAAPPNPAAQAPVANAADLPGDQSWRLIIKVLKDPTPELKNLETLRYALSRLNGGQGYDTLPQVVNNALPKIVVPTFNFSYKVGHRRRFATIMRIAPGSPLKGLIDGVDVANVNVADLANDPQMIAIRTAWQAAGEKIAAFHQHFMNAGPDLLRPTVVHGDFHYDNVFYDPVTATVTLIDTESMGPPMLAFVNGQQDHLVPPWIDFHRIYYFAASIMREQGPSKRFNEDLREILTDLQIGEQTLQPFVTGYLDGYGVLPAQRNALRDAMLEDMNREALEVLTTTWAMERDGLGPKPGAYSLRVYPHVRRHVVRPIFGRAL